MQSGSGGIVFHVMNRAARRASIFLSPPDFRAFEELLIDATARVPVRLLAYVIMPNHFHLVLWPTGDLDLSRFMQWLTRTHVQRWHLAHGSVGTGALYQGRFKAVAVEDDEHLLTVCRYVEQNPVRARLVTRATAWRWGSAWDGLVVDPRPALAEWPVARPLDWSELINADGHGHEEFRERIRRGIPFGGDAWVSETAAELGLVARLRGRGRPPVLFRPLIDQNPARATTHGTTATPR